ncbi:hypothetical protein M947_10805 [Sulfurimonas hongkongensis]|uniref:Uncharacterized protein n=1 Tax=Sulfurimonas hongkongensis TaxID=1172190 RepID=T0KM78_9BACT|nr:hypothetical protein [Sulfurimonas hongkongensis]EQB34488.1 hypothetical protein M947_10805 [Sulfurimonas hongkongensis]
MYKTQEEKKKYIDKIFKNKALFEWEVLHVSSHYDRLEIMEVLAHILVREKLRYELNFLYLEKFEDFKFSQIVNIIFHEIANEWVSFATEILHYPKQDAIQEIQNRVRVKFIHSLAKDYYEKYRRKIFEEVGDTFIELVANAKSEKNITRVIHETLQSSLIKNRQILDMHNFHQLYKRTKVARNIKNSDIASLKIKINDLKAIYVDPNIKTDEKERLYSQIDRLHKELDRVVNYSLDHFDKAIKRLKDTMVQSMMSMTNSKL